LIHDRALRIFLANNQPPLAFSAKVKGYVPNPTGTEYFNTVIQDPALRAYNEKIVPSLDRKFAGNKRFGSEYMRAQSLGQRNLMEDLNRQRTEVGYNAYQATQNRRLGALQMAPSMANAAVTQNAGYASVLDQLMKGGETKRGAETEGYQAKYGEFKRGEEFKVGQQNAGFTAAGQNIQRTALNQAQYATEESARLQREANKTEALKFVQQLDLAKNATQLDLFKILLGTQARENIAIQKGGTDNSGLAQAGGSIGAALIGSKAFPMLLTALGLGG
jgi:hypothetical protein